MQVVKTKPYIRCIDAQTLNRKPNLKKFKKKIINKKNNIYITLK